MKKIFYLSTCDTCKKILNDLQPDSDVLLQDIKTEPVSEVELTELKELSGSYEALFSKRARLYREMNLSNNSLSEKGYRDLILKHYTFLKRPVIVNQNEIFIGNSKKVISAAKISFETGED